MYVVKMSASVYCVELSFGDRVLGEIGKKQL